MRAIATKALETPMSELTEKEELLENSGYRYHFERMIYVKQTARRAFSIQFVEDHSHKEIQRLINEAAATNNWVFHFREQPSDRSKRELAEELER
jgi:hypothetical protein